MANRWFLLVLATALCQGLLALSPIPVNEDEWDEFARMLRNPAYRLPTTSRPRHYEVSLTPYFDQPPLNKQPFTFDGEVTIYLSPTEANLREIIMHCNDLTIHTLSIILNNVELSELGQTLTCEMPYSFLKLRTSSALQVGQEYIVKMTFTGNLQTNMRGFYRSWYNDKSGKRWMATTQFQPGHARQAFPCYDEPSFKATFDITIIRQSSFSPTISNMPIKSHTLLANDWISETFHTTPKTSTYLLAFIVSHYEVAADNNDINRPFRIFARNNVGITGQYALEIGEKLLKEMDDFTQIPFYEMAQNLDMKQAAIPDFSAGAMENWGLLTYREALILYDPQNTNNHYKQRIANIISHEITHMWFGNLVTCAWWDNLWLNEGFARLYQHYLTNAVAPEMGYDIRFIVEQIQTVMISDSIDSAHPLTDISVNDPTSVSAHFSSITYARGGAIIRMTHHLLGFETYRKGLRYYLNDRKYDVAEPHHLFSAWDLAAAEDGALDSYVDITIDRYFRTWSEKAGHPLVTVSVDQGTGRMIVTQARWERNTGVSQHNSLWDIPITWTRGGAPDFTDLKPPMFITEQHTAMNRGTTGLEWVIFNKQQSGFYRVNYDDTNWSLLTRALRGSERTLIHEINRAQIVDDLFAFARAGVLPYSRVFNIISFLEFEDAYAPWIAAINGFNFALRRLAHDDSNLKKLKDNIIQLSSAITRRLGFAEIQNETFMDGLLRMHVMTFLCNIQHAECVAAAQNNFQRWISGEFVPANMRPWVYCTGLRSATAQNFNFFWNRYVNEDLSNEKIVMLEAAGCTLDQSSLEAFLTAITDGQETVRPQDFATAFASATNSNEENTLRALTWLSANLNRVNTNIGSAATLVSNIAGRLLNEQQITLFQNFLDQNQVSLGSVYNTGVNGINTARSNLEWAARRTPEFETYFDTGYVEDVIEPVQTTTTTPEPTTTTPAPTTTTPAPTTTTPAPTTTTPAPTTTTPEPTTTTPVPTTTTPVPTTTTPVPPTEDPTTTPEPGSANIVVLSVTSVIASVCIALAA